MSTSSVVRAHSMRAFITKEKERILDSFASNPSIKHRATIKVARRILLDAPYLLSGRYWEVKSKSMGAGVYELSLEIKE